MNEDQYDFEDFDWVNPYARRDGPETSWNASKRVRFTKDRIEVLSWVKRLFGKAKWTRDDLRKGMMGAGLSVRRAESLRRRAGDDFFLDRHLFEDTGEVRDGMQVLRLIGNIFDPPNGNGEVKE